MVVRMHTYLDVFDNIVLLKPVLNTILKRSTTNVRLKAPTFLNSALNFHTIVWVIDETNNI